MICPRGSRLDIQYTESSTVCRSGRKKTQRSTSTCISYIDELPQKPIPGHGQRIQLYDLLTLSRQVSSILRHFATLPVEESAICLRRVSVSFPPHFDNLLLHQDVEQLIERHDASLASIALRLGNFGFGILKSRVAKCQALEELSVERTASGEGQGGEWNVRFDDENNLKRALQGKRLERLGIRCNNTAVTHHTNESLEILP